MPNRWLNPGTRVPALAVLLVLGGCTEGSETAAPGQADVALAGEMTTMSDSVPSCAECSIAFRDSVKLGSISDPVLLLGIPRVERGRDGRFYATVFSGDYHSIIIYTPDGRYTGVLGREGQGPAEFVRVNALAALPDSGLVVGHSWNRITVFDRDGQPRRNFSPGLGWISNVLPLADGRLILISESQTETSPGGPVHLLDSAGNRVRGLGGPTLWPPFYPNMATRFAAHGADGTVWIGENHNYRLELVDTLNQPSRVIGVSLAGQPTIMEPLVVGKNVTITKGRPANLPNPRPDRPRHEPDRHVDRAHVDSMGVMWVVLRVAHPGWADMQLRYDQTWPGENFVLAESEVPLYRTLVDAIDTQTGQVLARQMLDGYGSLTTDGHVVRAMVDDDGYFTVVVSRPYLIRQSP